MERRFAEIIELEKMLAKIDRQLAETQHRRPRPVWLLVAIGTITGVAIFATGAAIMKLFG